MAEKEELELSIIMPCLNEEKTVGLCVDWAKQFMADYHITGEVLVVDNGSTDASAEEALSHGARVVKEPRRGYGRALRTGMEESLGRVIIMGDADTTYDFLHLQDFYGPVADGTYDMIIGDRFAGGIEKGAMPFFHKIGVRILSFLGRKCYHVNVYDFHCGLRGVSRAEVEKLHFCTEGMEFATEMIAKGAAFHLRIGQVATTLKRPVYGRKSKLRTIRDGLLHLRYLLTGTS